MKAPRLREADTDHAESRANVLVVALDVVPLQALSGRVLVVAPALNSRLRRWASDEDRARRLAARRLQAYLDRLERGGIQAEGRVGDADPLLAIADALVSFPADEIVIAASANALPLAEKLVSGARKRFSVPTSRAWEHLPLAA